MYDSDGQCDLLAKLLCAWQAASFPAAQFVSAIGWGRVSDKHGRQVRLCDSNASFCFCGQDLASNQRSSLLPYTPEALEIFLDSPVLPSQLLNVFGLPYN